MEMVIRSWQKSDLPSVRKITWEAWVSTYKSFIPEKDLKFYFDDHYTEESLLGMFADPSVGGFIAEADGQAVGYERLCFNRDENRLYVSSLYLLPKFEGQGIGSRLLESAGGYATEKDLDELWIGVMVKNGRALHFYRRAGFQFIREEPFTMGKTTVRHLIGYKRIRETIPLYRKTYAVFEAGRGSLPGLCLELLSEQTKTWRKLREGYEALKGVQERDLFCGRFSVRLQYNPGRIKSTLAEVGERKEKERQCFLCLDHLPERQKGILYQNDYLILCNPMPVFPGHFIVSHLDHRLQAIDESIDLFLQLMDDFGSEWTVLYNGPRCGASAPDHLHFHANPSGQMPIEKEMFRENGISLTKKIGSVLLHRLRNLGREVLLLEGEDPTAVGSVFKAFLTVLRSVLLSEEEPMINMAGFRKEGKWSLLVFPRRRHRPEAFFSEGDARVVVSPGVIDMGGVLITPVRKDFARLSGGDVEKIYREVSLEEKTVGNVIAALD